MPELIPLSELPVDRETTIVINEMPDPRLVWSVDLPTSLDQDRLLLDVGHLRRLQKVSSNVLTLVTTNPDASAAEYESSIQGITFGGAAIRGRTRKTKSADPSLNRIQYEFGDPDDNKSYGRFLDAHLLNKPAMIDDVKAIKDKRDITNEEAWADTLDRHIQTSMRQAAAEVLLKRKNKQLFDRNWEALWTLGALGFGTGSVFNGNPQGLAELAALIAVFNQLPTLGHQSRDERLATFKERLMHRRWSLFFDFQPDRYLTFDALTRVNSLIKVKK